MRPRNKLVGIILSAALLTGVTAQAATLHVPGEYATIQAAIDAAASGDTVLVADGTYMGVGNRNLDFAGKAITVRSENGPEHCIIDCEHDGRGFYFHSGEAADSVVDGFTITRGSVAGYGGGIHCYHSSPTITNCTIRGNWAGEYAGGIFCTNSSNPTITDCAIRGNWAGQGGGVYCTNSSNPKMTNCTISGNLSLGSGSGVYCERSNPTITNCTICGNVATGSRGHGGGMYCDRSNPTLTNCVLWNDVPDEIYVEDSHSLSVSYCDVQGGWTGTGNIDADPLLAFTDDGHIMPGSPCIDAGTDDPPGGLPDSDPDGNIRPLDGDGNGVATADIGAYEFNPASPSIALSPGTFEFGATQGWGNPADQTLSLRNCGGGMLSWEISGQPAWLTVSPSSGQSGGEVSHVTLAVDSSTLPPGTYTALLHVSDPLAMNSPREVPVTLSVGRTLHVPGAYPTIQAAIDAAATADTVLVADGTYAGPGNKNLDFGGKAITVRSENGPEHCIIDCEHDGRGFYFHSGEAADSVVDGFTITNGSVAADGGGVYCYRSSPTITHCTIRGNSAASHHGSGAGGGVYCGGSSATISHCTISGNVVTGDGDGYGGGVFCSGGSPTISDCTVSGNAASGADFGCGGGVSCEGGSLTITNSSISGNSVTVYPGYGQGGGVFCSGGSLTITNCTVIGNTVLGDQGDSGGGICCKQSSSTISDCTISENTASRGGGVYCYLSSPQISNCILWNDTPEEIYALAGSPSVSYCDIQGGWPGEGNIDSDPLFVDPDGPDGDPGTWEDNDYHLLADSPCIDAGDNTAVPADVLDLDGDGDTDEPTSFDLDGRLRFADRVDTPDTGHADPNHPDLPIVDMGAYEYQCAGDLNGDGNVDTADLGILLAHYGMTGGATYADGDLNGDGAVDLADLAALLAAYGTACP